MKGKLKIQQTQIVFKVEKRVKLIKNVVLLLIIE